jgi:hypothetical protein
MMTGNMFDDRIFHQDSDGARLLDQLHTTLRKYVAFPDLHSSVGVALWIAATHALPAFECAPRLVITSPQKRCGKTRLLDIIAATCHRPLATSDATVAAIFRSIGGDHPPTLLIDEADAIFGTKKVAEQHEDLRKLLNVGHQRARPVHRCVGPLQIPTPFPTFAMAALAGIGAMPDTITDRAVNVALRRRGSDEKVAKFRHRRDEPKLAELGEKLAAWAAEQKGELSKAEPAMPVDDRAADTWEPLIAIADAAGGDWPRRARRACTALTDSAAAADDEWDTVLLADIRQVFIDTRAPFIPSNVLVRELRSLEESPWADIELTTSKLAKKLKPYGVKPGHNPAKTVRGYALDSFRDAFRRYLRPEPSQRPKNDSDQHQQSDGDESQSRPAPSESVRPDGLGRLTDTLDDPTKPAKHGVHTGALDGWTDTDTTPGGNGTVPPGCRCGRPGPINPETGLCYGCEHAASKQKEGQTERRKSMTDCRICGHPTTSGQSTHYVCGGIEPDDPRFAAAFAADHIVRLLKRKQSQRADELWVHLRPELADHFDAAIDLLIEAGSIRRVSGKFSLVPERQVREPTTADDGTAAGLFELPPDARASK